MRRVDARLQAGLRAAVAAYDEDLAEATREANAARARPALFQAALARGDAATLQDLLRYAPNVRVERGDFRVGDRPPLAAERSVRVVGSHDLLGYVIASVPFDRRSCAR